MTAKRFELCCDEVVLGVSETKTIAEGILFSDDIAILHWISKSPSSAVHYQGGIESIEYVHGHDGKNRIVWLDE